MANILDVIPPTREIAAKIGYFPALHYEREAREQQAMVDFAQLRRENPAQLINLRNDVLACTACTVRQEAVSPVPGVGKRTGIVVIGRNPGKTEDLQGEPFLGKSGKILDIWLKWAGLTRKDIFLTNLVLCHSYNDRELTTDEIQTCVKLHLLRYLALLEPYLVITLGEPCSKALAGVKMFAKQHGDYLWHSAGFWLIPAYHPGAILYKGQTLEQLRYDSARVRMFLAAKETFIAERDKRVAAKKEQANAGELPSAP